MSNPITGPGFGLPENSHDVSQPARDLPARHGLVWKSGIVSPCELLLGVLHEGRTSPACPACALPLGAVSNGSNPGEVVLHEIEITIVC